MVIYLSGAISNTMLANPRADLGIMLQPGMGNNTAPFLHWTHALDNGCFAQGERFDAGAWLEWLASMRRYRERCLFAVAPDVMGDAVATLARSRPYLATIRQLGFSAAFVAQDGLLPSMVPWDELDCLFIGGTDAFKWSSAAEAVANAAQARGKWVHVGRVNSLRRLRACRVSWLNSADGTYVKFGPDRNLPRVYDWLDAVNGQAVLAEVSA